MSTVSFIPAPLHADSPVTMCPENRAVWSPYWMVMAVNLVSRATGVKQVLILRSRRIGVYADDPDFDEALRDADMIAMRLLERPERTVLNAERHGEHVGRRLFSPQWVVRYEGTARTPLERYRQGDDPYDAASDLIAD